jgi:DNA repair protein RadC
MRDLCASRDLAVLGMGSRSPLDQRKPAFGSPEARSTARLVSRKPRPAMNIVDLAEPLLEPSAQSCGLMTSVQELGSPSYRERIDWDAPTREDPSFPAHLRKLLRAADEQIDSQDLLHLFLAYFVPSSKAEAYSERLLARFGSLGHIVGAPWPRLEAALADAGDLAGLLKTIHIMVVHILREPIIDRPVINSTKALYDYLKMTLAYSPIEMVRVLFLDGGNGLIKDEVHSQGTINHVSLYPREIVRRVLELDAKAIILVHNHPGGSPMPSKADALMTKKIRDVLAEMDVTLHDHIIVANKECVSFREKGLL